MTVRRFNAFGWENVPLLSYKEGGPYKDVTRQILFEGEETLPIVTGRNCRVRMILQRYGKTRRLQNL